MQPCDQREKIDKIEAALADINIKLAVITERLCAKISDIDKHISDGEKQGGWRDRLVTVEQKIQNYPLLALGAGIIGGLIGAGAPAAVTGLVKLAGII